VRVKRDVATILSVLCCAAGLPASAAADWSAPITVSPAGENSIEPQVALNERGDAVVVWKHRIDDYHSAVELVSRSRGGSFSAPMVVSPEQDQQNFEPQVALDGSGNAVVMWAETSPDFDLIRAAAGRAGGAFGAPVTIGAHMGSGGTHNSCIGVDAAGNTTAFWTRGYNQNEPDLLRFAVRPAGGSFGPEQAIPNPGQATEWPQCVVAANGDTVVSWTDGLRVLAAIRRAGEASFSAQVVRPFDSSRAMASVARLATNARGDAIVTWSEATDESGRELVNKAAWRPSGGSFGSPETVGPTYGGGTVPVVDADGTATLMGVAGTLQQPPQEGSGAVERGPNGGYGPYRQATLEGWDQDPEMTFDSAGNLFLAWRRYYDRSSNGEVGGGPYGKAYAGLRAAGGAFAVPETPVSDGGLNVWDMALDAGAAGHALTAWPRGTFPDDFHIEVSEYGGTPAVGGSSGGAGSGTPEPASPSASPGVTPAATPAETPAATPAGDATGAPRHAPAMRPAASPPLTPTRSPARPNRRHRCRSRAVRHRRGRRSCRPHRRNR
jgi:hypothetical protein